jgi:hypothetical protein
VARWKKSSLNFAEVRAYAFEARAKNYLAFSRSVRRQYLANVSKNLTPIERR